MLRALRNSGIMMLGVLAFGCGRKAPSKAPVTLSILGFGLEAGEQLRQDALEEFRQSTGVNVELIPTPGTSAQQLPFMLRLLNRHASSPDIYVVDTVWPGSLHEHLEDLQPYLDGESRAVVPTLLNNGAIGGRLVCLPLYVNGGLLYYRADLLRKYGYKDPPGTWKDLAAMASRIQQGERRGGAGGFWGYLWQGSAYEGLTCNALEWQVSFGGRRFIEDDGTVNVTSPRDIEAFKTAAGWIDTISPRSVLAYTESDTFNSFRSGSAAFMRYWSSAYAGIVRDPRPGEIGISRLPAGPFGRVQTLGGFNLAVSRYSAHKREAVQLVMYLTSAAVQRRRAIRRGFLPAALELYRDPELLAVLPQARVLRDAPRESWILRPSAVTGDRYGTASKLYYETVHRILTREVTAEQGLAALEKSLKQLLPVRATAQ